MTRSIKHGFGVAFALLLVALLVVATALLAVPVWSKEERPRHSAKVTKAQKKERTERRLPRTTDSLALTRTAESPTRTASSDQFSALQNETTLSITKEDSPDTVAVGEDLFYTLTVENQGSTRADNVIVTDNLPNEVNLIDVSTSRGTCPTQNDDLVECDLGNLGAGATATVDITVDVLAQAGDSITNTADVDANNANTDSDSVTTSVLNGSGGNGRHNNRHNGFFRNPDDFENFFDFLNGDDDEDLDSSIEDTIGPEDTIGIEDTTGNPNDTGSSTGNQPSTTAGQGGTSAQTGGTSAQAGGDADNLPPVSTPPSDVLDEIDTGGIPLPPTGGIAVSQLASLAGAALAPLVAIAVLAAGFSVRWLRESRGS